MAERVSINEAMPLLQGIVEWDELGLYLGLSDAVIKEIRSAYGDVSTKRMLMMSKWIQSDLEATWSKLAKALLKMNPPYKVVAAKIRQQRGLSPETRKPELGGRGEKYATMRSSNEEEIKGHFSMLLADVRKALQSHNVSMADLLEYMKHFFEVDACFANVTNISDTFTAVTVSGLWSYLHFSPLEKLTKRFLRNDAETKQLIAEYKSQLTGYQLTTKLIDYIKEKKLQGDDDTDQATQFTAEHYKKIKVVIQLDRKVSDLSLMYVQELWSSFAEEFNIPSLTAIIEHIAPGSLEITWRVPPHEAELIRPSAEFSRQHKITLIAIDDHIIYDEKRMVEYERRFLELCFEGTASIDSFTDLLQLGVDPNIHNKGGLHALWYASLHGRVDLVQFFMDHGAAVDLQTNEKIGETALHKASRFGHVNVITALVERGADVNCLTKTGLTPLAYASKWGSVEAVHLLLDRGADINQGEETPLWGASYEGRLEVVEALLDRGADNNQTAEDEYGENALITACAHDHVAVARLLIGKGSNVNFQTKRGWTPLLAACSEGCADVVKELLQHQIQLEIENNEGRTALLVACWREHYDIVHQLLVAGASPNAQDQEGLTALILATQKARSDIISALMDANADANITEKTYGWSAVFFAAKSGNLNIVQQLISRGASVELKDKSGLTAYNVAKVSGHQSVCDELQRHSNEKTKTEITKDQKEQIQTSSTRFMKIFDFLEKSLLRGRTEKRRKLQSQQDLTTGTSSNIIESRQSHVIVLTDEPRRSK